MNSRNLFIEPSLAAKLSVAVKGELSKFSAEVQHEFSEEYKRNSKSAATAYAFCLLFGLHYAYMGKWGVQLLFWLTGGGFMLWWLVDLFRLSGVVKKWNRDVAMTALRNLKAAYS